MRLPDPRERPWLTVAELAEITGEGEKSIRSAVAAGHLPKLSMGRYVRIPTAAIYQLCQIDPDMQTSSPARELAAAHSATKEERQNDCDTVTGL